MVNSGDTVIESFVSEGEWTPLREAAVGEDGTIPVKVIGPGWSVNGNYYSESMLRRDVARYKAGTKNFWNHPGPVAEREHPGGDLGALASKFAVNACYLAEGEEGAFDGPGIYTRARPYSAYRDRIVEMAEDIGMSHRAKAKRRMGEAEGRRGWLVEGITKVISVDYVATPAAGGAVLAEAEETDHMDDTTIEEQVAAAVAPLNEQIATLESERDALREEVAGLRAEKTTTAAAAILTEALGASTLPEPAKARLAASLAFAGGEFDADAYRATVTEAIETEAAYVASIAPVAEATARAPAQTGVPVTEGGTGDAAYNELRAIRPRR